MLINQKMIKWLLGLSLLISISIFFGLLFGLNYEEILVTYLSSSSCVIYNYHIQKFYVCDIINCGCSNTNNNNVCKNIEEYSEKLLLNYDDNSIKPIEGECGNGYRCCRTCCSLCTRTTCSDGSCRTSTYTCNCYCCESVSNNKCENKCVENYIINFSTNKEINFTKIFDNTQSMTNFIQIHQKDFICYVDYINRKIYLNTDMTPWKIAVLSLSICSIIIILILIIIDCFHPDLCCVDTFNYNNCNDCINCDCYGCNC